MFYVTKKFSLEMGHILSNSYTKQCTNFHGHSYSVRVTITKQNLVNGVVMDFTKLKEIFNESIKNNFDHTCLVPENLFTELTFVPGIKMVSYEPTAENLAKEFFDILYPQIEAEGATLASVEVQETSGNAGGYSL